MKRRSFLATIAAVPFVSKAELLKQPPPKETAKVDEGIWIYEGLCRRHQIALMQLVRNASGHALQPKAMVTWKSGYHGRHIGGYANTTFGQGELNIAGIVYSKTPVPNGEHCWICVQRVCDMICAP